MSFASITPTPDGSLAFRSSYDPGLVAALKACIPYQDRRWDAGNKCWLIAPGHEQALADICRRYLGVELRPPGQGAISPAASVQRLLKVLYIGAPKERDDGSVSAFGYADGDWTVIFPQDVLKSWFELGASPEEKPGVVEGLPPTLYAILGAKRSASEQELKKAYRNMARRWHPDVNRDDDAPEMMKRINDAWAVLSDPMMRRKYDAGLRLEASLHKSRRESWTDWKTMAAGVNSWRPPVRCGFILAEGKPSLGRFLVECILQWEDITDADGRILVTSWPMGAMKFVAQWV